MTDVPEHLERLVDRSEIEHMLAEVNAEKVALQARMTALSKASDSLHALLEMTPAFEGQRAARTAQGHLDERPRGKEAARLILESDQSRFWTVRDVWDEQVRRGWAQPRPPGARGNPPARIALDRVQKEYPKNVEVTYAPVLAYKWTSRPSPDRLGDAEPQASPRQGAPLLNGAGRGAMS